MLARLTLWLALAVSSGVAAGQPQPEAESPDSEAKKPPPKPYEVRIEGAGEQREMLERHLTVSARRAELAGQTERLRFVIDRTPEEAREMLATEGYFGADVSAEGEDGPPFQVRIAVKLGEPTRVRGVNLRFRGHILDARPQTPPTIDSVRAAWMLQAGGRFRQESWDEAKRTVLRELLANRYPAASIVSSQATIDPEQRAAILEAEFDSGPEFRFGALEVSGLERYPRSIVENLNDIEPGAPYSQRALSDLQTRLYSVPYFAGVNVVADAQSAADPAALPIKVEITEAPRRKVELGTGFSTNTGFRVQGTYTDINLLERGWRWRSFARIETREQRVETGLTLPVRPSGWQDEYGLAYNRSDLLGLLVRDWTASYKRLKTEGRIERGFTLLAVQSREFPQGAEAKSKQAVAPGYSWRYRDFDDVLDPRRGYEIGAQVAGAAKFALSDQNFVRTYGRTVVLLPLAPTDTLILRAEGGVVFAPSREGIPNVFLFRAGGDQSLRGYKYQSIGVREGEATVGGRYLVIGGVEYIRWVAPKVGVALFYETGDAFDDRTKLDLKQGFGIGGRWRSPVGPINFDVAYGVETRDVRFHFSLGFVF